MAMDESTITYRIKELVEEEHRLRTEDRAALPSDERRARLAQLEEALDQCWDLLRQRRARAEFGEDPDAAAPRPVDAVESYEQ
jgi:Protein of unknown function (DUF2630)